MSTVPLQGPQRPDLAPALTAEAEAELSVRPVVDGISRRVALKALGNAVSPPHIRPIFRAIRMAIEQGAA